MRNKTVFPKLTALSKKLKVGNTPLKRIYTNHNIEIYAKLEWHNHFRSVKDRTALYMLKGAETRGELKPECSVLIEPTSGNTGVALAGIAKALGYEVEVVLPSQVSLETKNLLERLNARIWEAEDNDHAISMAHNLVKSNRVKYFMPNQYENKDNVRAHYESTGPEIWRQTRGRVSHFVSGIGTGGTIIGVGKFLKEKNGNIKVYAVEPKPSHHIQGLRSLKDSNISKILKDDMDIIDGWIKVSDDEAFKHATKLFTNGIPVGPSSGAAYYGALTIASKLKRGIIVTVLPDHRDRHKSTFDKWINGELR